MAVTLPRAGRYKQKNGTYDWEEARVRLEAEPGEWVCPLDVPFAAGTVAWLRREGPLVLRDILHEIDFRIRESAYDPVTGSTTGTLYARWTPGVAAPSLTPRLLSEEEVVAARREYAAGGISQINLAQKFGITQTAMSKVLRGQTYPEFGGPTITKEKKK